MTQSTFVLVEGLFEPSTSVTPDTMKQAEKEGKKKIEMLARAFTDPLIVMPGGWADTIPSWMKEQIPIRRMIQLMKNEDCNLATDLEALIYTYTASLVAPFDREWVDIHVYLTHKCITEAGREFPEDELLQVKPLDEYQLRELNELKRWIRNRQETAHKRG